MKNDLFWTKSIERFITILNVLVDIIGNLFFQLVSILKKLHSMFKSFFTEELKAPEQHFYWVYAPIFFLIGLCNMQRSL